MAAQVFTVNRDKVKALLAQARAEPVRKDGTSAVYVSKSQNLTYTLFPAGKDQIRVQVMSGCVC